jgi:hydroxyacylglutathione hydrolase
LNETAKTEIITIPTGKTNCFCLRRGNSALLVDSGVPNKAPAIQKALVKNAVSPQMIQAIVITHAHYDHVGSLRTMKALTGAKVAAHRLEAEKIEKGVSGFPRGTILLTKIFSAFAQTFLKQMGRFEAVGVEHIVEEEFDLREFGIPGTVIHTPGHTDGSVSVILDDNRALVGDTMFNIFPNSFYPPFADNPAGVYASWRKLLDTGCAIFYPAHGKPIAAKEIKLPGGAAG